MDLLKCLVGAALVTSIFGCAKEEEAAIPKITSGITVSARTATSFSIAWSAATDEKTASTALEYKIYYSSSDNISSPEEAVLNGTMLLDWTANVTSGNLTSLTHSTPYYVIVLVRDEDQKIGLATVNTTTLCSGKRMFLANVPNGSFGGITGADAACAAQKPAGVTTAKAMISSNAANPNSRTVCNTTATPPGTGGENCLTSGTYTQNWVVGANTTLCTADYEGKVGTTNAFGSMSTGNNNTLSGTATTTFTGMNIYWGNSIGNNCANWSSTSGTATGGSAASNGSGLVASSFPSCGSAGTIYCVEQ